MSQVTVVNAKLLDEEELKSLYEIIIKAYALTENLMWGENYVRIPFGEYFKYVQNDEIFVALLNREVVGGIRFYDLNKEEKMFSLFGADFNHSGKGIGESLIQFILDKAKHEKIKRIKIEILRPADFELPDKKRLANWYKRFGFNYTGSDKFEDKLPKAQQPITKCVFDYYQLEIA